MNNPFDLTGRVALVTGAGRGLGLEMARSMACAGAHTYISARDEARLLAAQRQLLSDGIEVSVLAFDVTDEIERINAIDTIVAERGRLDILINNVGQRMRQPIDAIAAKDLAAMLDSNVVSFYALARAVAPLMAQGGYGRIIMMSSIAASVARMGDAAYITSKGAVEALTRALACEWGSQGVLTNAIAPGGFTTETNGPMAGIRNAQGGHRAPVGRWGRPEEIGPVALFLASPASSYVNGIVLPVDGGVTVQF